VALAAEGKSSTAGTGGDAFPVAVAGTPPMPTWGIGVDADAAADATEEFVWILGTGGATLALAWATALTTSTCGTELDIEAVAPAAGASICTFWGFEGTQRTRRRNRGGRRYTPTPIGLDHLAHVRHAAEEN
jgi:hypothetical protein